MIRPFPTWFALVVGLTAFACSDQEASPEPGSNDAVVDAAFDGSSVSDSGTEPGDSTRPDADADSGTDAGTVDAPARIFFVGNSFTLQGPIPVLVDELAVAAGFPDPIVDYRAVGGRSLAWHREDSDPANAPDRIREGWDVVVLQDYSTRPTDSAGDPAAFKADAAWFHDLARGADANARVVLYETWARRFNHPIYPGTFDDPADMQAQLRDHYFDAADRYIPETTARNPNVVVAPVGDAWEAQLLGGEPPRLHGGDDYHASAAGQYLNALVIFATIYGTRTQGLPPIGVSDDVAATLQAVADATTGNTEPFPGVGEPTMPIGSVVRFDLGPISVAGWETLENGARTPPLRTGDGRPTTVTVAALGFDGNQTGGSPNNTLGWPPEVSSDTLWVGSFDGHDAALGRTGTVRLDGLPAGSYHIEVFASRNGNDGGNGRLTRYAIGNATVEYDPQNNTGVRATFANISAEGALAIEVSVSPAGTSRFGYVGAVELTRVE